MPSVRRATRSTDFLHATVQLGPGLAGRPHNDPTVALRRIDDAGIDLVGLSGATMAKGSLTIEMTDARGGALSGKLHIELDPHAQAIGGDAMEVSFNVSGHTRL